MDYAYDVWKDLEDRFAQGNAPTIFQIKRMISSLAQDQSSVATYFTKLKALWDELASYSPQLTCTCGGIKKLAKREQEDCVILFLLGLNESYSAIRGQILLMQPLPVLNKAYSLVLQEEKQRDVSSFKITEASALAVNAEKWLNPSNKSGNKNDNRKDRYVCTWKRLFAAPVHSSFSSFHTKQFPHTNSIALCCSSRSSFHVFYSRQ